MRNLSDCLLWLPTCLDTLQCRTGQAKNCAALLNQYCLAAGLVLPRLPASSVHFAVAIVGAIIMPHNIYLHSALVQSRSACLA